MARLAFQPGQGFHPLTFEERGVAVPFTTPRLVGTRARPGMAGGIELLVPNPSGGSGVYVLPWDQVGLTCRPTVHDKRLNDCIRRLVSISPSSIREAARQVAAEGLAGRAACAAAIAALAADRQARCLMHFRMLMTLREHIHPTGIDLAEFSEPVAALEQQAWATVLAAAPQLGLAAEAMPQDLEQLAAAFVTIGLDAQVPPARVPMLLSRVVRLHEETTAWSRTRSDRSGEVAGVIGEVADITVALAASTLRDARAALADLPSLLRRWTVHVDAIKRLAARPEWLLDGWEQVCLLWEDADTPDARPAAIAEMVPLAPVMPRETFEWVCAPPAGDPQDTDHTVQLNQDWRTGAAVFDLVSRNERLRARST